MTLALLAANAALGQKVTLSGHVREAATGETFIGATVYLDEVATGTVTNAYGFYSITVAPGNYTLQVSYLGYATIRQQINLTANTSLDFRLEADAVQSQAVELVGERREHNVQANRMSNVQMDIKQVKSVPALFGEADVLRVMQTQAGVITAGEGTTSLFVRGGSADQNLILIDEAPVYNPSHLLGMFSTFNSDALKSAELYKGGMPAYYGGRLSSVLDIRTRDGNNQKFGGTAGIGLLSSRIALEGPIQKDKSSFLITGRRTYADLFLKLSSDPDVRNNVLYFYDLNAKMNFKLGEKDRLYVAGYLGQDVFRFGLFGLDWGNATGTVRWNHVFNQRLFLNSTAIYSNFNYGIRFTDPAQAFKLSSGLQEWALKEDFTWFVNPENQVTFGLQASLKTFVPAEIKPLSQESIFRSLHVNSFMAMENAVYVANDQKINDRLNINYGLRFTLFSQLGHPTDIFTYASQPFEESGIVSTRTVGRFKHIKSYPRLEPRISARYILNENTSLKGFYNRTYQFVNLVSNSTSPLPTQTWIPSTNYIKPQEADQFALGIFRNLANDVYEVSTEVFYKNMRNVADFRDNAELGLSDHLETEIRQGRGWAYGAEFSVKKVQGRLTGWANYTLSKAERQVAGVNEGRVYRADYDRRHNANVVLAYELTRRFSISGAWTYGTGRPFTLPAAYYNYDFVNVPVFSERNGYVMPSFHRLDVSATLKNKVKPGRRWTSEWNFSVYNLYNRKNPFTVYTQDKRDGDGKLIPGKKEVVMAWLFPILPSATYTIHF